MSSVPKSQYELTAMLAQHLTNKTAPDLKHGERWMLVRLSMYGNATGGSIYPSLTRLSDDTGMSRQTVIDTLKKLEAKGYLGIIKGGIIDGQNVPNSYAINMEKLGYEYDVTGKLLGKNHLKIVS